MINDEDEANAYTEAYRELYDCGEEKIRIGLAAAQARKRGRAAMAKLSEASKQESQSTSIPQTSKMTCQKSSSLSSVQEYNNQTPIVIQLHSCNQQSAQSLTSDTSTDSQEEFYSDVFLKPELTVEERKQDLLRRIRLQEDSIISMGPLYDKAIEKMRMMENYRKTMQQLEYALRLYNKQKALKSSTLPLVGKTFCQPVEKFIQREHQEGMELATEQAVKKSDREQLTKHRDDHSYDDHLFASPEPPPSSDLRVDSLMKTDSFIDLYFEQRKSLEEDEKRTVDAANAASLSPLLSTNKNPPSEDFTAKLGKKSVAVQVVPNRMSRASQSLHNGADVCDGVSQTFVKSCGEKGEEITSQQFLNFLEECQPIICDVHQDSSSSSVLVSDLPTMSSDANLSPPSSLYLKALASNFANFQTAESSLPISKQAVPLSEPVRSRPDSLPISEGHVRNLVDESVKKVLSSTTAKRLDKNINDEVLIQSVQEIHPEDNIVDGGKDDEISLQSSSSEIGFVYHDLSTIQELDSILTNVDYKEKKDSSKTQYQKHSPGASIGNILIDNANSIISSPSDCQSFQLLTPYSSSSGSDSQTVDGKKRNNNIVKSAFRPVTSSAPSEISKDDVASARLPVTEVPQLTFPGAAHKGRLPLLKTNDESRFQQLTTVSSTLSTVSSTPSSDSISTLCSQEFSLIYESLPKKSSFFQTLSVFSDSPSSSASDSQLRHSSTAFLKETDSTHYQLLTPNSPSWHVLTPVPVDSSSAKSPLVSVKSKLLATAGKDCESFQSKQESSGSSSLKSSSNSSRATTPADKSKGFPKHVKTSAGSSDDNLSHISFDSKAFCRSTPVKELQDLAQEEQRNLADEPDLSLVDLTLTRTEGPSPVDDVDHQQSKPVDETLANRSKSESMLSFLQHERSAMELDEHEQDNE